MGLDSKGRTKAREEIGARTTFFNTVLQPGADE